MCPYRDARKQNTQTQNTQTQNTQTQNTQTQNTQTQNTPLSCSDTTSLDLSFTYNGCAGSYRNKALGSMLPQT